METNGLYHNDSLRGAVGPRNVQVAQGIHKSMMATGSLPDSHNPYAMYGDSDSLDVGVHEGLQSQNLEMHQQNGRLPPADLPSEAEIRREFADYMDATKPLSEPEEIALQNTTTEEKWELITNQKMRSPIFPIRHYIESLRQNQGTRKKKFSLGRSSSKGVAPLTYLLRKLKSDLKMSPPSFLEEFSEPPNGGVHLLVHLLRTMQIDQNAMYTNRKSRVDEYRKLLEDEADCLLCLKFLTRTEQGCQKLSRQEGIFELITQATLSNGSKNRAIALQLLSALCEASTQGYQQTMEAMSRQRQRLQEPVIFKTICTTLNTTDGSGADDIAFILATVHFFNTIVASVSNASARVYLQYEMERAGFNPDELYKYSYGDSIEQEDLGAELETWRKTYINVTATREDITNLESRNQLLRQEVTRLQEELKALAKTSRQQERENRKISEKKDNYRERAAELQDTVEKLTKLLEEETGKSGITTADVLNVEEVLKPLDAHSGSDKYATVRSISSLGDEIDIGQPPPSAPPLPPPAPPMTPPRRKIAASVEMPMLNWIPIHTVTNTIFQDLDDENVYKKLDFADFEARFKLQRRAETSESQQKKRQLLTAKQHSNKVLFVNLNRAKNICITKHRTGLTSRQIREAIERCDVKALRGEWAELLIKFIPTKDELKLLAQHREEYSKMGEAEQFLFQLAQVERLESKLSLLAFIGIFEELMDSVRPGISCVYEASLSVTRNKGLRKIFEVILAFGNYMNGAKRGYAMGFRLESLYKVSDVKTVDRSQTLMHYLAEQVAENYPELLSFYDDVHLRVAKGVSFHSMQQDVKGLRKGLDLVKFEKEKQKDNPVLERFYGEASRAVADVAENFKRMEEAYRDVCIAFGENYKNKEPDTFFGTLADFASDFKAARQENLMKAARLIGSGSPITKTRAAPNAPTEQTRAAPKPNQTEPVVKRETPKIKASLTPQASPKITTQAIKREAPKPNAIGGPGPVAAQHNVLPSKPQSLTNGHREESNITRIPRPSITVKVPEERPRAGSEPSTADINAAIGTLDAIFDEEEKLEGIPEQDTYTSYL